ncbi:MAG: hypothetical protein FJ398_11865 [Verrucomicrobia bacterium]|nr:hypothetical protein [Verrucomicrobiota bacterium]
MNSGQRLRALINVSYSLNQRGASVLANQWPSTRISTGASLHRRLLRRYKVSWLALALSVWLGPLAHSAEPLRWHPAENQVDANFDDAELKSVLAKVAQATGWQIYVEPDTTRRISVKFRNLAPGEALRRLLGDLNFALLPQTNAPSRLFIYRTSLQEATQLITPAPEPKRSRVIPNELIVALKPGSKVTIDELARRLGAKVVGNLEDLHAYRLQFKDAASADAARQLLATNPSLARVDSNYLIDRPTQTQPLQMSSTPPFPLKPKVSTDTGKVVIGLIDMAVQPLSDGMNEFLLPAIQVSGPPGPSGELPSHGTSMAETILRGLAATSDESGGSAVRILPVDVYGPRADTTTFDVARGVYAAVNAGATIINLSMGGDGESGLLANLIRQSHNSGVLFFGAAGNEPTTVPTYPAAYPEVVAVTSGDKRGNIAPFANRGSFVDVVAPGVSIVNYNGQSFFVSGTSTSTAYMSGAAAASRAAGNDPAQVEAQIRQAFGVKRSGR